MADLRALGVGVSGELGLEGSGVGDDRLGVGGKE